MYDDYFRMYGIQLIFTIINVIGVGYFVSRALRRSSGGSATTPTLALTKFEVDPRHGKVMISGRPGGIIDWILTIIGLQSTTTLTVTPQEVRLESSSLFGEVVSFEAVPNISSVSCALRKPFALLIFGVLALVAMLGALWNNNAQMMILSLLVAGVFFAAYALLKTIEINIESSGGSMQTVRFKRSIIENIPVDIARAREAVTVISRIVLLCHIAQSAVPSGSAAPPAPPKACGKCGSLVSAGHGGQFCENCGAPL